MKKRLWILTTIALVLAGVYIYFFIDWSSPKTIHISYTERPMPTRSAGATIATVVFGFDRPYRLSEVKVVPLAAGQTNQSALPIWHLVSDSRSARINFFLYGQDIPGLKPATLGARPQPLQPHVAYRIFVAAGRTKGQHDFEVGGRLPDAK